METWYLAGNCIDRESFATLVKAFVKSPAITNLWLKRNPLGRSAASEVFDLVTQTRNLRTLDLDLTSFGDCGVAMLFHQLADVRQTISLRNIYLNANGIGPFGAQQIARYLKSPRCQLESLYLNVNPLGNEGVQALAQGLKHNISLKRLSLASAGISDAGAKALFDALANHPSLKTLMVGTAYQTEDLGGRFNYFDDSAVAPICQLLEKLNSLQYLNIGYTMISCQAMNTILSTICGFKESSDGTAVSESGPSSLLYFFGRPRSSEKRKRALSENDNRQWHKNRSTTFLRREVHKRLQANVQTAYGVDMSYERFEAEEKRYLVNSRDVRFIDSVYRNRDASLARQGLKWLEKG